MSSTNCEHKSYTIDNEKLLCAECFAHLEPKPRKKTIARQGDYMVISDGVDYRAFVDGYAGGGGLVAQAVANVPEPEATTLTSENVQAMIDGGIARLQGEDYRLE